MTENLTYRAVELTEEFWKRYAAQYGREGEVKLVELVVAAKQVIWARSIASPEGLKDVYQSLQQVSWSLVELRDLAESWELLLPSWCRDETFLTAVAGIMLSYDPTLDEVQMPSIKSVVEALHKHRIILFLYFLDRSLFSRGRTVSYKSVPA